MASHTCHGQYKAYPRGRNCRIAVLQLQDFHGGWETNSRISTQLQSKGPLKSHILPRRDVGASHGSTSVSTTSPDPVLWLFICLCGCGDCGVAGR